MFAARLALAVLGVTAQGHDAVTATVAFSAMLQPEGSLTLEQHDLGGNLLAVVGSYGELHTADPRHETVEQLAMTGDSVDFVAGGKLVARRYRHDHWPSEIQYARR